MKRIFSLILAAALVCALAATGVLADGKPFSGGFYNIGSSSDPTRTVTITPKNAGGEVGRVMANVDGGTDYETFYPGSDRLSVVCSVPAGNYVVILVSGGGMPSASDAIYYIDQDSKVEFTVFPREIVSSGVQQMTLWITGTPSGGGTFTSISIPLWYAAGGSYEEQPYILGDVTLNGEIDGSDVSWILQYLVGLREFNSTQLLAADVTGNNELDGSDAARLLRMLADGEV